MRDFDNLKINKILNIIFLLIFFAILYVQVYYVRSITYDGKKIQFIFGSDFDKWFDDNFVLKNRFVTSLSSFQLKFSGKNEKGIYDKDTQVVQNIWEFYGFSPQYTEEQLKYLPKVAKFFKDNNIDLYILIVPTKALFYPSKKDVFYNSNDWHKQFLNQIKAINKEYNIKIIYPYAEMLEANRFQRVYFKTEHHWTDDGAYAGYIALMNEIKKDYPNIKILEPDDFYYSYNKKVRGDFNRKYGYGTTSDLLGFSEKDIENMHKEQYRYYKHKDYNNLYKSEIFNEKRMSKDYFYPKGNDLKVILLGTSQSENLTEFIPFTFKTTRRIRNNVNIEEGPNDFKILKQYKKEILEYKPDIVILCFAMINIHSFKKLPEME